VPSPGSLCAYRDGEGPAGADKHHQFLGPGHAGVEQVALQHHVGPHGKRYNHGGVFAALGAVDGDRVGVGEFVERVVDRFVLVGQYGQLVILREHAGDDADGAVEDASGALLVTIAELGRFLAVR
jgi:hypothetical protein